MKLEKTSALTLDSVSLSSTVSLFLFVVFYMVEIIDILIRRPKNKSFCFERRSFCLKKCVVFFSLRVSTLRSFKILHFLALKFYEGRISDITTLSKRYRISASDHRSISELNILYWTYTLIRFSSFYVLLYTYVPTVLPKLCSFLCFPVNFEHCPWLVIALSYSL